MTPASDPLDQRLDDLEKLLQTPTEPDSYPDPFLRSPAREIVMTLFSVLRELPRAAPSPEARLVQYRKTAMTLLAGKVGQPDYPEQVETLAHRIFAAERSPQQIQRVMPAAQVVQQQAPQQPWTPPPPQGWQTPPFAPVMGALPQEWQQNSLVPPQVPAKCCAGNGFGGHAYGCQTAEQRQQALTQAAPQPPPPPPPTQPEPPAQGPGQ